MICSISGQFEQRYHPFRPPAAIEWTGGRLQLRELDAAGRPVQVTDGEPDGLTVDFGFSSVSNLTSITEPAGAVPADVTLTHAPFGRLTGFLDAQTAAPKYPRNVRRR